MTTKTTPAERDYAIAQLRRLLSPGTTVYTNLRHVSQSGMSRHISLHVVEDGRLRDITVFAARALDYPLIDKSYFALRVGGAGMDMGFHVVYSLGRTLYPDGTDGGAHSGAERDGGYALRQEWI